MGLVVPIPKTKKSLLKSLLQEGWYVLANFCFKFINFACQLDGEHGRTAEGQSQEDQRASNQKLGPEVCEFDVLFDGHMIDVSLMVCTRTVLQRSSRI